MQPDPVTEGRRWLDQAVRDLDDARFAQGGDRHNLACFLSQQAAEKALKGLLLLNGEQDVWGHSVADLCARAMVHDEHLRELSPDANGLDVYYIPTRYPNGLPGGLPAEAFDEEDSTRAIARATRIIDHVRSAFATHEERDSDSEPHSEQDE